MAIKDLHCVEGSDYLAVIWAWDQPTTATITMTRLLDGNVLDKSVVSRDAYNQARLSVYHGPRIKKANEPVRITVESQDGAEKQEIELLDRKYTVGWYVAWRQIFRKGWFSRKLVGTQANLVLNFPCQGKVPNDLFYYTLGKEQGKQEQPDGFLPRLQYGKNVYGLLSMQQCPDLHCNPKHAAISRLFDFQHLPDKRQELDIK